MGTERGSVRARTLAAALVACCLCGPPAEAHAAVDASPRIAIGAYVPEFSQPYPVDPAALDEFSRRIGDEPVIVSTYKQWRQPPFVPAELAAISDRDAVPLITWEPFNYDGGKFPLDEIAAGRYDPYLVDAARAAVAWGRPILLRFAHEMNGSWYPWGNGVDSNTPDDYKRAWRHIVDVFREQGADEVEWVWAPQINKDGELPFTEFFPGDRWVDWVGLDGYNAGVRGNWDSFTEVFGPSYEELVEISSRPILITETGSSESGGEKAAWVRSALEREIPAFPRIRGVVWFSDSFNDLDFRIPSSAASLRAFRAGIASPRYSATTRADLLRAPAEAIEAVEPATAPAAPSDGYGRPSLWYRLTQKLHGDTLWIAVGGAVAAALALALAFLAVRRRRTRNRIPGQI